MQWQNMKPLTRYRNYKIAHVYFVKFLKFEFIFISFTLRSEIRFVTSI